jgi:hypothetical protein
MQHRTNSEELLSKRTLRTENGTPSTIMYCKCKCNRRVEDVFEGNTLSPAIIKYGEILVNS